MSEIPEIDREPQFEQGPHAEHIATRPGKRNLSFIEKLGIFVLIPVAVLALIGYLAAPPGPKKPDKDVFKDFYGTLMQQSNAADQMFKPFADALSIGDLLQATIAAKRIHDPFRNEWLKIDRTDVPELQNQQAYERLKKGKGLLADAVFSRLQIIEKFLEFAKNPSVSSMADVKENADMYQRRVLFGIATLFEAGSMVGIEPKDLPKL